MLSSHQNRLVAVLYLFLKLNFNTWLMIYFALKLSFVNRLKIPPDCTTELNHHAYLFLQSTFDKHDLVSF